MTIFFLSATRWAFKMEVNGNFICALTKINQACVKICYADNERPTFVHWF